MELTTNNRRGENPQLYLGECYILIVYGEPRRQRWAKASRAASAYTALQATAMHGP